MWMIVKVGYGYFPSISFSDNPDYIRRALEKYDLGAVFTLKRGMEYIAETLGQHDHKWMWSRLTLELERVYRVFPFSEMVLIDGDVTVFYSNNKKELDKHSGKYMDKAGFFLNVDQDIRPEILEPLTIEHKIKFLTSLGKALDDAMYEKNKETRESPLKMIREPRLLKPKLK